MSFNWTADELQEIVDNNPIVLFMKGTPEQPRCGFSNRAAMVLGQLEDKWASIDVTSDPRAISSICTWSDFPTMPQIFINGELIGGSDIVMEMYESGELAKLLETKGISFKAKN